ncbi:MAG: pyridoxal-phosphate dependent enzyme, partial [Alphaproteobacteria bacterium]|nr:pyridoxal-phosphate dependent enzyme [Alphaproteobacteria bacterium]
GNHSQALAYHALRMNIPACVVMPGTTPLNKISRCRSYGPQVILSGQVLDESIIFAKEIAKNEKKVFIHPFDDESIIAGQGTIGLEIFQDKPDLDYLIVPIGGGGLISGIATAVKALNPKIKIIGVVSDAYPQLHERLQGGIVTHFSDTKRRETLADGIAVKKTGEFTFELIQKYVDEVLVVDEHFIELGVFMLSEKQKFIVEGAGAVPLAAALQYKHLFQDRKIGLVISGGNIDLRVLSSILMRGLMKAGRLARINVSGSDAPGTLAKVASIISQKGGNVIDIFHQRVFYDSPVKRVDMQFMIEFESMQQMQILIQSLNDEGFDTKATDSIKLLSEYYDDHNMAKFVS